MRSSMKAFSRSWSSRLRSVGSKSMGRHDVVWAMRAIQIQEFGGPEVLVERELPDPQPANGMVVLDVSAAGINYADTHHAENSYLAPAQLAAGGYAERALAAEAAMWDVPDGVSDAQALALVLQGTTAWHLLRTSAQLREGESVVVHAAADGGERVDVVLEMVGGRTFAASLSALAAFGRLVHFGQAGREAPPPIDAGRLMATSRGVLGFWLVHMLRRPDLLGEAMRDMFDAVLAGEL